MSLPRVWPQEYEKVGEIGHHHPLVSLGLTCPRLVQCIAMQTLYFYRQHMFYIEAGRTDNRVHFTFPPVSGDDAAVIDSFDRSIDQLHVGAHEGRVVVAGKQDALASEGMPLGGGQDLTAGHADSFFL